MLKFVSWNVNGVRAILGKNFLDHLQRWDADVICLQETKASSDQVTIDLPGYEQFWNWGEKKGYSGTAVFTRVRSVGARNGMGVPKHDNEGRVITVEYPRAYLVNVYTPNSQNELRRLEYRTQSWEVDFLQYLKELQQRKPVILCGDLNVAHKEIDIARPKENQRTAGFTLEERERFDALVAAGFVDTFREFTPEGGHYTWWNYRTRARERNVGWRIDYFCISSALRPALVEATILADVTGSDHCPVTLRINADAIV